MAVTEFLVHRVRRNLLGSSGEIHMHPRSPRLFACLSTSNQCTAFAAQAHARGLSMKATPTHQNHRKRRRLLRICVLVASSMLPGAALSRAARTGILIHGCHLGAKGWRSIMWGNEQQQQLGRLPHGARLAWEENACVVVLGTGASERDGVVEGRYALEYLKNNWDRLREFDKAFSGVDIHEMRRAVQPLLVAEVRSQNTRQELLEAGRIFRKENCDRVILVSSPTHLPRCLRDASSIWLECQPPPRPEATAPTAGQPTEFADTDPHGVQGNEHRFEGYGGGKKGRRRRRPWLPLLLASPSDTNYAGYGPDDVAIVEPPHRGDSGCGRGAGPTGARIDSCGGPDLPRGVAVGEGKEVEDDALAGRGLSEDVEKTTTPLLLLHDLTALALRVGKSNDERFRKDLQELLRRYVDVEK